MTRVTTDPNDPELGHGADETPAPQSPAYLVLSAEERAKGFVRPVRSKYTHVGLRASHPLRDLTDDEKVKYNKYGYVKYEAYPPGDASGSLGRFWTQIDLDTKGCGTVTTMGWALSETYARQPDFYGTTYCVHCSKHRPVEEFVWDGTNEPVGS